MKKTLSAYIAALRRSAQLLSAPALTADPAVDTLTYDTRTLSGSSLFICKGAHFKEEYLRFAAEHGAVAYVSETVYPVELPCILVRDIRFAKEPLGRVDFTEKDGKYSIRLALAAPCEDVTCEFLTDVGRGPAAYSVNGRSSCDLKPLDASRKVWGTDIEIKSISAKVPERFKKKEYHPFVKVSVLGGGLDTPIFANMYKK